MSYEISLQVKNMTPLPSYHPREKIANHCLTKTNSTSVTPTVINVPHRTQFSETVKIATAFCKRDEVSGVRSGWKQKSWSGTNSSETKEDWTRANRLSVLPQSRTRADLRPVFTAERPDPSPGEGGGGGGGDGGREGVLRKRRSEMRRGHKNASSRKVPGVQLLAHVVQVFFIKHGRVVDSSVQMLNVWCPKFSTESSPEGSLPSLTPGLRQTP